MKKFAASVAPTELRLIAWQKDLAEAAFRDGRLEDAAGHYSKAAEGLAKRVHERRSDAVISNREWDQQRSICMGIIETAAAKAGL